MKKKEQPETSPERDARVKIEMASDSIEHLSKILFPGKEPEKNLPIIDFDSVEHLLARNLLDLPTILRDATTMSRKELGIGLKEPISHENIKAVEEPGKKTEVLTLLQ